MSVKPGIHIGDKDEFNTVALAPYTLATMSTVSATKSTELATMSTAKMSNLSCCRFVAKTDNKVDRIGDNKSTVSATVDSVAALSPVSAVDFVVSVYLA